MKAAVFYKKEDLRVENLPMPEIGAEDVLIKVKACGICGTDMHIFDGDEGAAPTPAGTVLGHEFAGEVIEVGKNVTGIKIGDKVCAGRVLVDGYGVGDVGNVVLRDRKHLGEDGIIVVVVGVDGSGNILSGPEVISRGFVYVKESGDLMEEIRDVVFDAVESARYKHGNDFTYFKSNVRNRLSDFIYEETKRKPMILPIVMEI